MVKFDDQNSSREYYLAVICNSNDCGQQKNFFFVFCYIKSNRMVYHSCGAIYWRSYAGLDSEETLGLYLEINCMHTIIAESMTRLGV